MKLSIITPVLNSHEIVRRQMWYYKGLKLPGDVEIIYIDDGSEPPLDGHAFRNFSMYRTKDYRPWTEHKARNIGVKKSRGEYVLLIDVDYILPKEAIMIAREGGYQRMAFKRYFGVLDEYGNIDTSSETLKDWGLKARWIRKKWVYGHRSQFAMKRSLFDKMGGYNEALDGEWRRTGGAGEKFWRKWQRAEARGEVKTDERRPIVFMFPVGKFCDVNVFKTL